MLDNENEVYLRVRALDAQDKVLGEINQATAKSKLSAIGGKRFLIDIWPRGFFSIDGGAEIARLEYFFTDASGTKVVGYGNTDQPFKYSFRCK